MSYDDWLDSCDPGLYAEEPAGESADESLCRLIDLLATAADEDEDGGEEDGEDASMRKRLLFAPLAA